MHTIIFHDLADRPTLSCSGSQTTRVYLKMSFSTLLTHEKILNPFVKY